MPTWILGPDPNKQCCGCQGKNGPCDSCCPIQTVDPASILISPDFPSGTLSVYNQFGTISKDGNNGIITQGNGPYNFTTTFPPEAHFQLQIPSGYYIKLYVSTELNAYCTPDPYSRPCVVCSRNGKAGGTISLYFTSGYSGNFTNIPSDLNSIIATTTNHEIDALCGEIGEYDYNRTCINGSCSGNPRHAFDINLYSMGTQTNTSIYTGQSTIQISASSFGFFGAELSSCDPHTYSNNSFCRNINCNPIGCDPPTSYTFTPGSYSALSAPDINLSQTSQITNSRFNGTGILRLCSQITLIGNAKFYLYDQNMMPVDITGLLIKFHTSSLP